MELAMEKFPRGFAGTFVSLYTGAGGLDLGFCMAGFQPIWANDIDTVAVKTYNHIFETHVKNHVAVVGDIRMQQLPMSGTADLVIGGPPCQGFSVAGKMNPNDPRSKHVWDFLSVVDRVRPKAFVMENVKSLANNKRWAELIYQLQKEAEKLGYTTRLFLLNASHFDVPQARERMFMIGVQGTIPIPPQPITKAYPPSVRQVLSELPPFGAEGNNTICPARITPAKKPVLRNSPYAGMLFNGQGRPLNLDRPAITLPASMGGNRTPIVDQHQIEGTNKSWVEEYHAHLMYGGKTVLQVPEYLRRITVEEAAAIQTFPPGTSFQGTQTAKYRQIGNAVPPNLAYHVALSVRATLDKSFIVSDQIPTLSITSSS